jgi:hypothetical protein
MLAAKALRINSKVVSEINTTIREIIGTINREIEAKHENCEQVVVFDLPTTFNIHGIDQDKARRKIYSAVIEDLTSPQRGFNVQLKTSKGNACLLITWYTPEDAALKQKELSILEYYSLSVKDRKEYTKPSSRDIKKICADNKSHGYS